MRAAGLVLVLAVALSACAQSGGEDVTDPGWHDATALTPEQDHATGVATDGSVVVFSTGGSQVAFNSVSSVPLSGGDPTVLVQDPLDGIPSSALAILDDTVYFSVGRSIASVPIRGGDATAVVTDRSGTISSIATDGERLFWTTGDLNQPDHAEIGAITLSGGDAEVLADHVIGNGSYTSVVPDGAGGAYAASPGGIIHAPADGEPEVVVSAQDASGAVTRIAVDGDRIYGVVAGGRADLFAVPRAGGEITQLARHADSTGALAATSGGVTYFLGDDLRWVPGDGGESTELASGQYADGTIAVAGDRLVFPADWRIWSIRLRRCG